MTAAPEYKFQNWIHYTENSIYNPVRWKINLESWINTNKPLIQNIHGSISNGVDVHLWILPGDPENPEYKPVYLDTIPADDVVRGLSQILHDGTGVEIGFNTGDPPAMWVATTARPVGRRDTN